DVRTVIGEDFVTGEAGEEVETLGGYLVTHVGRLPVRGEVISGPGNYEIEVLDADPRRVKRLRIAPRKERPPARSQREGRRRDPAVQCVAHIVRHLSGRAVADRWVRSRKAAWRARGGFGRLVVRAGLFRARTLLARLCIPGRRIDLRLADAVRGAGSAGLPGAISRRWFCVGTADLDQRRLARDRACYRSDT